MLFQHLVMDTCSRYHEETPPVASFEHIQDLQTRRWEGNICELKNKADKFVLGLPQAEDTPAHLEFYLTNA